MVWLTEIPACVVQAHVEMLPRLIADESLRRASEAAVGNGIEPGTWIKDQLAAWERTSAGGRRGGTPAAKVNPAVLQAMGIRMQEVAARG
jgi:hypothetical protein